MADFPAPPEEKILKRLVRRLAREEDSPARRKLLRRAGALLCPALVVLLCDEVVHLGYRDLAKVQALAVSAEWVSKLLKDPTSLARSHRASGHFFFLRQKYGVALKRYDAAIEIFRRQKNIQELGRTLSSSLGALSYLGRYEEAFQRGKEARRLFSRLNDTLRLARLDSNIGSILYRQDRFGESLEYAQRAYRKLLQGGGPQDIAIALRNLAVRYISVNEFSLAEETYRKARAHCQDHGLLLLVAETDYNIAYLYYLRGEYTRAIEMYEATRRHCVQLGDSYHKALCDLDQSELSLELNLYEEGEQLAGAAFSAFRKLGMGYEAAKAKAFLAIAASQLGREREALGIFRQARKLFVAERNVLWPYQIDVYQALLFFRLGRYADSRKVCDTALRFFAQNHLSQKAALCELLKAQLNLQGGKPGLARRACQRGLQHLRRIYSPALETQAQFVLGQIEEAQGQKQKAKTAYRRAQAGLENLRNQLRGDGMKIAFIKDKQGIFESLVVLELQGGRKRTNLQNAFIYIEQAKSRSLADLIAFRLRHILPSGGLESARSQRARNLQDNLKSFYRSQERKELEVRDISSVKSGKLSVGVLKQEGQYLRLLSSLSAEDKEFGSLQGIGTRSVREVRASLPDDATLVEYYLARGVFYACVLSHKGLDILPVAKTREVQAHLRLLQFQLNQFRLQARSSRSQREAFLEASRAHLRDLYKLLVGPIQSLVSTSHVVLVPHGFLHYVPFHALLDGDQYLLDRFSISYAPSASVFSLCQDKQPRWKNRSLVLGVPDAMAPFIGQEAKAVASLLPRARLFLGKEATIRQLETEGKQSRFIHIATHGLFRQDNPMFSSLRLGDARLTLFDLYSLDLSAELVTLSGCGTGLNYVVGGEEIIGLVRGFLYSGAHSVLVSLWDIQDKSTAEFMTAFYLRYRRTKNKAAALQGAMQDLRRDYPHPYYWAPFCLVGKYVSG